MVTNIAIESIKLNREICRHIPTPPTPPQKCCLSLMNYEPDNGPCINPLKSKDQKYRKAIFNFFFMILIKVICNDMISIDIREHKNDLSKPISSNDSNLLKEKKNRTSYRDKRLFMTSYSYTSFPCRIFTTFSYV